MKLLHSTANCLLDRSSGGAISVRTFLEALTEQGLECRSLTSTIFDAPVSSNPKTCAQRAGALPAVDGGGQDIWYRDEAGVRHFVIPAPATQRTALSRDDEMALLRRAVPLLDAYQPDALLTYDSGFYERALLKIARDRGVATLFYLANPTYVDKDVFQHVDCVFTDTDATRQLYEERLDLRPRVIGKFVRKPGLPANAGGPDRVTFVNPSPQKGVTLFYRMVELAREVAPDIRFLAVESRLTLEAACAHMGVDPAVFDAVERVGLQDDMGEVYARTKVLLLPSLWHESGSRSIVEACSLGIPVVASDRGGTPDLLGQSGVVLPVPEPLIDNHWQIPSSEQAAPWVDAVRRLMTDEEYYGQMVQAALAERRRHDPGRNAAAVIEMIADLVASKDNRVW